MADRYRLKMSTPGKPCCNHPVGSGRTAKISVHKGLMALSFSILRDFRLAVKVGDPMIDMVSGGSLLKLIGF